MSGTATIISLERKICRTDIEIAFSGTSASSENQPLIHLLLAARLIEIDDEVRISYLKIRRRIVKREVPILSDSGKENIHGFRLEFAPQCF